MPTEKTYGYIVLSCNGTIIAKLLFWLEGAEISKINFETCYTIWEQPKSPYLKCLVPWNKQLYCIGNDKHAFTEDPTKAKAELLELIELSAFHDPPGNTWILAEESIMFQCFSNISTYRYLCFKVFLKISFSNYIPSSLNYYLAAKCSILGTSIKAKP